MHHCANGNKCECCCSSKFNWFLIKPECLHISWFDKLISTMRITILTELTIYSQCYNLKGLNFYIIITQWLATTNIPISFVFLTYGWIFNEDTHNVIMAVILIWKVIKLSQVKLPLLDYIFVILGYPLVNIHL